MKRLLGYFILAVLGVSVLSGQTATNFQLQDCNGKDHDLFQELDSGYVVVVVWVMPCGTCVAPSITSYNVVRSYDTVYPNKIRYFLVDDYGNTSCTSIKSWGNQNGLSKAVPFSNAAIKMSDYGNDGMPKVVILAGKDHSVMFNENNNISSPAFKSSLDLAIGKTLNTAVITENQVSVNPNPVTSTFRVSLNSEGNVRIKIYNSIGTLMKEWAVVSIENGSSPELDIQDLPAGLYTVEVLTSGSKSANSMLNKL